jgi:LmbE family N-acetylglucosaminyl deacetylase
VNLLLAPHNDDETLFCSFTIQRDFPLVVIVFDSYVQEKRGNPVTWQQRRGESVRALKVFGHCASWNPHFVGVRDDEDLDAQQVATQLEGFVEPIERVFAPAIEPNGHAQHNAVGAAADLLWPGRVTHYLTYTRGKGKSTSANRVAIQDGEWIRRKLRALACYESQINIARLGCREHFCRDLWEYYE